MATATLPKVSVTVPHSHYREFHAALEALHLSAEEAGSDGNTVQYHVEADSSQAKALRAALAKFPGIQI